MSALGQYAGDYDVSAPALRTAQRDTDGRPVGVNAYDEAEDAIRAGDMAAFLTMLQLQGLRTGHTSPYAAVVLSLDTAAGGDCRRTGGPATSSRTDADQPAGRFSRRLVPRA